MINGLWQSTVSQMGVSFNLTHFDGNSSPKSEAKTSNVSNKPGLTLENAGLWEEWNCDVRGEIWVFPKIWENPQIIHLFIGFSIIFTIHFWVPLFLETTIYPLGNYCNISPFKGILSRWFSFFPNEICWFPRGWAKLVVWVIFFKDGFYCTLYTSPSYMEIIASPTSCDYKASSHRNGRLLPKYSLNDIPLIVGLHPSLSLLALIRWKVILSKRWCKASVCPQKLLVSMFKFNHLDRDFSYTCVVAHPEIHLAKVDSRKSFNIFHRCFPLWGGVCTIFGPIYRSYEMGCPSPRTKETTAWVWTFFPATRRRWRTTKSFRWCRFSRAHSMS